MTLTEFLRARFDEDEAMAREFSQWQAAHQLPPGATIAVMPWEGTDSPFYPNRVLAEVEAKRRIVERCADVDYAMPSTHLAHGILAEMALPYADHPDYDQEWRP